MGCTGLLTLPTGPGSAKVMHGKPVLPPLTQLAAPKL